MDVTERLLNAKVMFFLEFLWFAPDFCTKCVIRLEKCSYMRFIRLKKCVDSNIIHWKKCNFASERI